MQCPHCEKWSTSERHCDACGASLVHTTRSHRPPAAGAAQSPYAPPSVPLGDAGLSAGTEEPAGRGRRLAAACIDSLLVVGIGIILAFTPLGPVVRTNPVMATVCGVLGFLLLNSAMLASSGQTVGKRLLGIRIAARGGTALPLGPLLLKRYLPFWAVSAIPIAGPLFCLVDSLFIFRADHRCLHDHFADTQVLRVG